jgi:shikimate dehydrogenase
MHTAALAELGLADEWTYEAIEVEPAWFAELVSSLEVVGFAGVNVTLPHKVAALEAATETSPAARAIGAANTLSFDAGIIAAENTDATGIVAAIGEPVSGRRALVLGAGGSARAAVWALREEGAEVSIWNRTPGRAVELAMEFNAESIVRGSAAPEIERFDLIVNATTLGLEQASERPPVPEDLKALPFDADAINERHVVMDLAYGSHETALASRARERGARLIDGLEVLVHQGAASLRIWTGREPPIETMRTAARGS